MTHKTRHHIEYRVHYLKTVDTLEQLKNCLVFRMQTPLKFQRKVKTLEMIKKNKNP